MGLYKGWEREESRDPQRRQQRDGEPGQWRIETRGCRTRRAREGRGSEKSWRPMFRNKQPI